MHNREPKCYFNSLQQRHFTTIMAIRSKKMVWRYFLSFLAVCKNSRPLGINEVSSPTKHLKHSASVIFKPQGNGNLNTIWVFKRINMNDPEEPGQQESSNQTGLIVTSPTSLLSWLTRNSPKDRNLIAISMNFKSYTCKLILTLPFTNCLALPSNFSPWILDSSLYYMRK